MIAATVPGFTVGTNLFLLEMPDQPDNAASLTPYGGGQGVLKGERGLPIDELPRFQVRVRHRSPPIAEAWARSLYEALHVRLSPVGSTPYLYLEPLQPPYYLEKDASRRTVYVFNVEARRLAR
ncbi:hypothetical protein Mgrana_00075 [Meiothermus granaticius NBRC 107808]|uniref:Uncharacterized protein n=2 Tax=Meiothermus TaxID=65551 RepID=A0A399FEM8_9DEIN|nr:hypothetical protein Mgrana_00075 [Meiothermus granaticius NBRC 107808]